MTEDTPTTPAKPERNPGWSIKRMPFAERDAALAAAERASLSVGDWLALAIRDRIKQERAQTRAPALLAPATAAPRTTPTLDEIAQMVDLAGKLATLTQEPPPPAVTRLAYRHLRRCLTQGPPRSDPAPHPVPPERAGSPPPPPATPAAG